MKENRSKIEDLQSVINIHKHIFIFLMKMIFRYEAKKRRNSNWVPSFL